MGATWRNTDLGTFEAVDRQEPGIRLFGAVLLLPAVYLLYVLATWVVEMTRVGTLWDVLAGLPGVLVTLVIAGLFGAPGAYMALRTRRTTWNKGDGTLRHVTSYGVWRRTREFRRSDVASVIVVTWPRGRNKLGKRGTLKSVSEHTVELQVTGLPRIEVATFGKPGPAAELGRQLSGEVGTELRQELR